MLEVKQGAGSWLLWPATCFFWMNRASIVLADKFTSREKNDMIKKIDKIGRKRRIYR